MSEWWRGAVIYQIYPRSFADSNGDGVGDLRGATEKLDHVAQLGADGVWLSPVFASPMKDFGYDVSDYRAIDPLFGTMTDFDAFLGRAHALGLKVIIDQVYSHTSDEHAWFNESRADRTNAKADWYVWADAKPDGSPPNNWQSLFGGPSWEWDTRRRQYYLHNFLREQPDLNVRNPDVQTALLDVARFWLDKGVDGFRLDVINFLIQDEKLRDNPARGFPPDSPPKQPHAFQRHLFDRSQPETLDFIAHLRALLDSYDDRFAVGEIEDEDPVGRQLEYADGPSRLHTAYSFELLRATGAEAYDFGVALHPWDGHDDAWPSWSLSNHDVPRFATRMAGDDPRLTRVLMAALLTMYGTIFLYQGDELGLPQAHAPFEALRDPEAIRFYPDGIGRDGARTPMPWTPAGGFSSSNAPWLPYDPRHLALSVEAQARDPDSMLAFTRKLIALRKAHPALRTGRSIALGAPENVWANARIDDVDRLTCVFNFAASEQRFTDGNLDQAERLDCGLASEMRGREVILPPYGGAVFRIARAAYKSNFP